MTPGQIPFLSLCAAALFLAIAPVRAVAQLRHQVGVEAAGRSAPSQHATGDSAALLEQALIDEILAYANSDSAARPLIRMPGFWPDRITHQNVAALVLVGAIGFGIVWALPEEISQWDKSIPISVYLKRAYTRAPVWDNNKLYWNYVVHPVTGSWVYLMERNHNRKPMRGFLLSTAASIGWEYGFEAMIEQPSIQDLIITSTAGSLIGELSYKATLGMRKNGFNVLESIALTIINPAWVVSKGYR